ncbi:hypothetical protein [Amorphus sp. 3PC139-8]|uniref:hypothetical protein n=1 Tax=Amorphus sp. 3PC139-8 TaxID=2735676 RepID=UPI00345DDA42
MALLEIVSDDFVGVSGFVERFGPDLLDALSELPTETRLDQAQTIALDARLGAIAVRLRGDRDRPFETLRLIGAETTSTGLVLELRSDDCLAVVSLELDLAAGRLVTDIARGFERSDSGTFRSAAFLASRNRFIAKLIDGGVVEVSAEDGALLGRSAPHRFTRIDMSSAISSYRAFAHSWNTIAAQRLLHKPKDLRRVPAPLQATTHLSRIATPAFQ